MIKFKLKSLKFGDDATSNESLPLASSIAFIILAAFQSGNFFPKFVYYAAVVKSIGAIAYLYRDIQRKREARKSRFNQKGYTEMRKLLLNAANECVENPQKSP